MITLTAKINLLSNKQSLELADLIYDTNENNISKPLSEVIGKKSKETQQGDNPFIIGYSKTGDGSAFCDGVDYFITKRICSNDNPYYITIKSDSAIKALNVVFDKANLRFPKSMEVRYGYLTKIIHIDYDYGSIRKDKAFTIQRGSKGESTNRYFDLTLTKDDFKPLTTTKIYNYSISSPAWGSITSVYIDKIETSHTKLANNIKEIPLGEFTLYEITSGISGSTFELSFDMTSYLLEDFSETYRVIVKGVTLGYPVIDYNTKKVYTLSDLGISEKAEITDVLAIKVNPSGQTTHTDYTNCEIEISEDKKSFSAHVTYSGDGVVLNEAYSFNIQYRIPKSETLKENFNQYGSYTVDDDDATYLVRGIDDNNLNAIQLRISEWNSEYPVVVTEISAEVSIDIDNRSLISLSGCISDRSDFKLPSYGIISNTGDIEFNDVDGEIRDYAEQLLLQSGLNCTITLNNNLTKKSTEVAHLTTENWSYDNENRVVSVSLKDELESWQDINVEPVDYNMQTRETKPLAWFYNHLWKITNARFTMQGYDELDSATKAQLDEIIIQYPLLETCTLWQAWQKVCEVGLLHIYKDSDGIIKCKYNGGN